MNKKIYFNKLLVFAIILCISLYSTITCVGQTVENTTLKTITIPKGTKTIADSAYYSYVTLSTVIIPKGVTKIGNYAFAECKSLTSITIPKSVKEIGESAFSGCESLTSITIPEGVTSIGFGAFSDCTSLTSITLPTTLKIIGVENDVHILGFCGTFSDCTSLTSITIPESVTTIGEKTFNGCTNLTSINVNPSNKHYKSIDSVLYDYDVKTLIRCPQQKSSITIPESVTTIDGFAFEGCESLKSITIPEGVSFIFSETFWNCSSLKSITLPSTLKGIEYAYFGHEMKGPFLGCKSLTSITIPDSVSRIDDYAFSGANLTSIYVNPSNKKYKSIDGVLYDYDVKTLIRCPQQKPSLTIPESVTKIGKSAFSGCANLTSITIPEGVTTIEYDAFSGCANLTSITIPKGVSSIEYDAFWGCANLTSINVDSTNKNYKSIDGVLYDYDTKTLIYCPQKTSITIPRSVTKIKNRAFINRTKLTSINVDLSNKHYKSIDGVLYDFDTKTLLLCPQQKSSITIPKSVTTIGECNTPDF